MVTMKKFYAILFLILLMIFLGLPSAQSTTNPICIITGKSETIGSCITSAFPISFLGILISVSIIAIAFMISQILNLEGLKAWYTGELWETTKSILVIGLIFTIIFLIGSIAYLNPPVTNCSAGGSSSSLQGSLGGLYQYTDCYMVNEANITESAFYNLYGLNIGLSAIKSLSISSYFPLPITIITASFGSLDAGSIANLYVTNIIDGSSPISFLKDISDIIIIPLYIILDFFVQINGESLFVLGLAIFLPIGIILRAFPFVRGIGGEFIGIGLGLGLILPILLLYINAPITSYVSLSLPSSVPFSFSSSISADVVGASALAFQASEDTFIKDISTKITPPFNTSFTTGATYGMDNLAYPSYFVIWNYILAVTLPVLLMFILLIFDLIILIIASDSIARLLGGRVRLGIGKFKIA